MTDEESKKLGKKGAEAMLSAVLAASPRLDTFSTWLMGITTGFLIILFTNIERTVSIIKIGSAKALIIILTVSTVIGLLQKYQALQLQLQADIGEALNRKMVEAAKDHSGQSEANPIQYFRDNANLSYMLALFSSAFPNWFQKILLKIVLSTTKPDLSDRQRDTKRLFWQFAAIIIQLISA